MPFAVPLELSQIASAQHLYDQCEGWKLADEAIRTLGAKLPGFSLPEVLLKTTVVDALYSTNLYAVAQMAEHIADAMAGMDIRSAGPELVELLAVLEQAGETKDHRYVSFASKFAHFFVDPERYPIMDKFAMCTLELHVGKKFAIQPGRSAPRYADFSGIYGLLKEEVGFTGPNNEMDHYLWLAGLYVESRKNPKAPINKEVRALFADRADEFHALVPRFMLSCALGSTNAATNQSP